MSPLAIISQLDVLPFFFVLAGSFLPALLWLWFWAREDYVHPEPKMMLILTFFGGMASVFTALVAQNFLYNHDFFTVSATGHVIPAVIILYVATEELSKFFFAYIIALRSRADDEPVDPMIYMIASALGFSALENVLFITGSILDGGALAGFTVGILRYLGATLLHILASGAIGVALGLSFYKESHKKFTYVTFGIVAAVALHTAFNLLIMTYGEKGLLYVFAPFWLAGLGLILSFERIKKILPMTRFVAPPKPY